jgi:hypothetical protein
LTRPGAGEVGLGEGVHLGGGQRRLEPLGVDLAVAGQADRERLARAVGVHERDQDVLQGVAGGPCAPVGAGVLGVGPATRVSIVGVSGVSSTCAAGAPSQSGRAARGC